MPIAEELKHIHQELLKLMEDRIIIRNTHLDDHPDFNARMARLALWLKKVKDFDD